MVRLFSLDDFFNKDQRRAEGVRMLAESRSRVKSHFLCASKQLGMGRVAEMREALRMLANGVDIPVCQSDWPVGPLMAPAASP